MKRRLATMLCVLAGPFGAEAHSPSRPACLGEFRSLEHQVGWSPLILIGSVEEIQADPQENRKAVEIPEGNAPPTIARVKVLRILKGLYDQPEIRIGSGPIGSCAPWPVHYGFKVGEKQIFILPAFPQNGTARLAYGGSMLDCEKTLKVESRLSWARAFRDAYLEEIRQRSPQLHQEAIELAKGLRNASPHWPKEDGWPQESPVFAAAKIAVVRRISKIDAEAIRAAAAVDWLDPVADPWWKTPLWKAALREVGDLREEDLLRTERARLARELRRAGVNEEHSRRYLESVDLRRISLEFPPDTPEPCRREGRDNFTTEFILRCHAYDRGSLFAAYAMGFEQLANLDPDRIALQIPMLYGSDDERVRQVASRAIEQIPGVNFVDLVLRRIFDDPWAWFALKHPKDADQTNARLTALLDMAEKLPSPYRLAALWRNLGKTRCFEKVCIDRAIAGLRAKEAGTEDVLLKAFHEYLRAAMGERKPPDQLSAEEYRKWFASNPAPEK